MRGLRRSLWLLAGGIIMAGPVHAQDADEPEGPARGLPPGAIVQPLDNGPGAELRRNLTTLAANPGSLEAMIGAGRAAARSGDGEAALGFFTRAGEISPSDPRVKAGLAAAQVLTLRPETALVTFAEAVRLGASEADLADDRGLAYDMVGDPARAQRDYETFLRRHPGDAEVERRLALSLAITGQRASALRVLDAQLRRQDRAGWRAQAFVLALTGDARGAEDIAARMMPPANAQAMAPFLARLASLSASQKAAAVHFGRFPSDGRTVEVASNDAVSTPLSRSLPASAEPVGGGRRRPGETDDPAAEARWSLAPSVGPARRAPSPVAARFAPNQPDPEDEENGPPPPRADYPPPPASGRDLPREAPAFSPNANLTLDTSHEEHVPPPPSAAPASPYPAYQPPSVQRFQTIQQLPGVRIQQLPSASARPVAPPPAPRPAFSDVATFIQSLPREASAAHAPVPATESPADRRLHDAAARAAEARYRGGASSPHGATHPSDGRTTAHEEQAIGRSARHRSSHPQDDEQDGHNAAHGRGRNGHGHSGNDDDDARTAHGRGAHGGAHARSGRGSHADEEDRSTAHGRGAHGHASPNEARAATHGGTSSHSHGGADDNRSTHGRSSRTGHGSDDAHAAHGHGAGHDRRDGDESRSSRSRSGTQQRPAAHGRHAH